MTVKFTLKTIVWSVVILALVFALLAGISVATWEYTNSDSFCSNACHDVHPQETFAHHGSHHSSVKCVECHVGRLPVFKAAVAKSKHISHPIALMMGYERPLFAKSMPASRDSCEGCHSTEPHQNNAVRVRHHYAPDEANTETKIALILRTAGRQLVEEGKGIHWHTSNRVRYVATDPQKENIIWVESTRPDGSVVTYTDSTATSDSKTIAESDKRVMECTDCHNQTGHPFDNPEELIDKAMADDPVIRRLPFVKARVTELLHKDFETDQEALELAEQAWEQYKQDFPDFAQEHPEAWKEAKKFMRERVEYVGNLMARTHFRDPGLSWRSFPNHQGHKYAAGCFRCHNGKFKDAEENPIPFNCTLCHSVPMVIRHDEVPRNLLALVDMVKPPSHQRPDFIGKHYTMFDATCSACHGDNLNFGTDDKTFCSNSGCHGTEWPNHVLSQK